VPQLLLTILLIAIGWFLLIRPQQARVRDQRAMVAALAEGDLVITAGGIHGRITALATETVQLAVAPHVEVTLARAAVVRRLDAAGADQPGPDQPGPDQPGPDPHEPDTGGTQGDLS
jgi:preprotein translocase subunit YajC